MCAMTSLYLVEESKNRTIREITLPRLLEICRPVSVCYKVFHLLVHLGWVDIKVDMDFECSTVCWAAEQDGGASKSKST